MLQFEGSEPLANSVLGQRQRPTSDINNSSSVSPAHPKVTRSISANQKQRRYSDHGGDDDGGGGSGVVEKPSKVTSYIPGLRVLQTACCVGGGYPESLITWRRIDGATLEKGRRGMILHTMFRSATMSKHLCFCLQQQRCQCQIQIKRRQKSQEIGFKAISISLLAYSKFKSVTQLEYLSGCQAVSS